MNDVAPGPLRFLYLHPVNLPGVEANLVQTCLTCRALAERGHEVFLIVPKLEAERPEEVLAALGIEPHPRLFLVAEPAIRLKNSSGLGSVLVRACLLVYLRSLVKRKRTVIYFRTLRDSRLVRFLIRAGRLLRVPVVYEAHKLYQDKRREQGSHAGTMARIERLERHALTGARGVVASHPILEADIGERFPQARPLCTIPNGVFVGAIAGDAERFDAVYAGSLFAWKGVEICLEAAARVKGLRLLVVGGNPPERLVELKEHAIRLGIEERVTFAGQLPRNEALALVARARVALIPLRPEHDEGERHTLPLKLLEALSMGVPVIAADMPALGPFVRHAESVWMYEPGNVDELATGLRRVTTDQELAERLRRSGREVADTYTFKNRARKVEEFCRSLLPGG